MTTDPGCACGQLHAIGYIRLSNLTEATTSPERQREQITSYCGARGWHLVDLVEDLGESGSRVGKGLARPGLTRIRDNWEHLDVLVVAKLDRLARNVRDFASIMEEAAAHDAVLAVVQEGLDLSTSVGRFVATILAAFAEMEAEQIKERVTSMRADARVNHVGRFMGGTVPFGYRKAPRAAGGKTLVVDEAQAVLVREAARRVLDGDTLYAISTDWNARGITTKYGKRWMGQTVRNILTGNSLIGAQSHSGEPLRDAQGVILEVFPPILDRGTWEQLRGRLIKPGRVPSRRLPARLLSGVAVCGECGTRFYARTKTGGRRDLYECGGRRTGKGCGVGSVVADDLDAEVVRQLLDRLGWYHVIRRVEVATDNTTALAEVEEAIRETTRRLGAEDDDEANMGRLVELKGRRAVLRQTPEVSEEAKPLGALADYWEASGFPERVRLLRDLLEAVRVSGVNVERGVLDAGRVELALKPDVIDPEAVREWYRQTAPARAASRARHPSGRAHPTPVQAADEVQMEFAGRPIMVVGGRFRSYQSMWEAVVRAANRGEFGQEPQFLL